MKKLLIALLLIPSLAYAEFIGEMGKVNPYTTLDIIDEFMAGSTETGEIGDLGWSTGATVGTITVSRVAAEANNPGMINVDVSATLNGIVSVNLGGGSNNIDPDDSFDITFRVRPQDNTNQELRVGMQTGATSAPGAAGIYFIHDTNTPNSSETAAANPTLTEWACVTRASSVSTLTDANVTVTINTWYKMRITRDASNVYFYIDNVLVCTHTTNIPSSVVNPMVIIENLEGVDTKNIDWDYFRLIDRNMSR